MAGNLAAKALRVGLLLALLSQGCGGDPGDPDDTGPCPDQPFADLNLLAGRLAGQLYRIDIGQLLLLKGATARFATTVEGHGASYSKQEMYDLITAAVVFPAACDSARSLLAEIRAAADTIDPPGSWRADLEALDQSLRESDDSADSLFSLFRERARAISEAIGSDSTNGVTLALSCAAAGAAPRFEDLIAFAGGASRSEWSAVLPTFLSCAGEAWSDGYDSFTYQVIASLAGRETPLLGPVALDLADTVASVEAGWGALETWAGGTGALRVGPSPPGSAGTGLLLLFPEEPAPSGVFFQPFFLEAATVVPSLPGGSFRLLAFLSGARPYAAGPFTVAPGETTYAALSPVPLEEVGCTLEGGDVPLSVFDPSDVEHLANDYTLTCRTEVWEGTSIFQTGLATLPGCRVRAEGTFRLIVHCGDRTLSGRGSGTISIVVATPGDCAPAPCEPSTFTFRIEGSRTNDMILMQTRIDAETFVVPVSCPGDSTRLDDITAQVFPDRRTDLTTGVSRHAESAFGTPNGPVYVFTGIDRVY